jgi:hypothetical protein
MNTVIEEERLKASRAVAFDLIFREIKIFFRRANAPADRQAFAELQHEILKIQERWQTAGLIDEPDLEEPAA